MFSVVEQKMSNGNMYGFIFSVLCCLKQELIWVSSADFWVAKSPVPACMDAHTAGLSGRGGTLKGSFTSQREAVVSGRVSPLTSAGSRPISSVTKAWTPKRNVKCLKMSSYDHLSYFWVWYILRKKIKKKNPKHQRCGTSLQYLVLPL